MKGEKLFRCRDQGEKLHWILELDGRPRPIASKSESLGKLLSERPHWELGEALSWGDLRLESPVTAPAQILCQGKNYLAHVKETGVRPEDKNFNMFFTKASGSLTGPNGPVVRPKGVTLLDYELELGLVIGQEVRAPRSFHKENLWPVVAGLVIANDVSARDIQVPQKQWFKGKSYRSFCPVGPYIYLWTSEEQSQLDDLELELKVDGEVRQKAKVKQMIYSVPETLSELSALTDLHPGDLILTGTPGGVAMRLPTKSFWQEVWDLRLSETQKFARFIETQQSSPRYLRDGQWVEGSIRNLGGSVDLGQQKWRVRPSF